MTVGPQRLQITLQLGEFAPLRLDLPDVLVQQKVDRATIGAGRLGEREQATNLCNSDSERTLRTGEAYVQDRAPGVEVGATLTASAPACGPGCTTCH